MGWVFERGRIYNRRKDFHASAPGFEWPFEAGHLTARDFHRRSRLAPTTADSLNLALVSRAEAFRSGQTA